MFNEINRETKFEQEKSEAQFRLELAAKQKALNEPPKSTIELRAAYKSNDPAVKAAAGTTAADTDYIAALSALAGN